MMARTQITLDPEHHRRARERASSLGISLAEYIRTLVERDIARPHALVDPSAVFDLGESRGSDIARHKREYLSAAVGAKLARSSRRRLR